MTSEQYRFYMEHKHAPLGKEEDDEYIDDKNVDEDGRQRGPPGECSIIITATTSTSVLLLLLLLLLILLLLLLLLLLALVYCYY